MVNSYVVNIITISSISDLLHIIFIQLAFLEIEGKSGK